MRRLLSTQQYFYVAGITTIIVILEKWGKCHECTIYKAPNHLVSYTVMVQTQTKITNKTISTIWYRKVQRKQEALVLLRKHGNFFTPLYFQDI